MPMWIRNGLLSFLRFPRRHWPVFALFASYHIIAWVFAAIYYIHYHDFPGSFTLGEGVKQYAGTVFITRVDGEIRIEKHEAGGATSTQSYGGGWAVSRHLPEPETIIINTAYGGEVEEEGGVAVYDASLVEFKNVKGESSIFQRYPLTYSDFLYFSYVTLMTVGYGDITPNVSSVRTAVVLELSLGTIVLALFGVYITYLVSEVARKRKTASGAEPQGR